MNKPYLFLACGDLHLTSRTPSCRIDDYVDAELKKFEDLMMQAQHTHFRAVLCSGDVFDHSSKHISFSLLGRLMAIMEKYPDVIFVTVPGNHDQRYWATEKNEDTALSLMEAACKNFVILKDCAGLGLNHLRGTRMDDFQPGDYDVKITAAQWGTKIEDLYEKDPIPAKREKDTIYVGLTHRPVYAGEVPFWMKENPLAVGTEKLVNNIKKVSALPDFIITGDTHDFFIDYWPQKKNKNTVICNPGAMMRSSIDRIDYQPRFVACKFDPEDKENMFRHFTLNYSLNNYQEVFDAERRKELSVLDEAVTYNFDNLVKVLHEESEKVKDFPSFLQAAVRQHAKHLEYKLWEILEKYEHS